jgi:hypothetical protein
VPRQKKHQEKRTPGIEIDFASASRSAQIRLETLIHPKSLDHPPTFCIISP